MPHKNPSQFLQKKTLHLAVVVAMSSMVFSPVATAVPDNTCPVSITADRGACIVFDELIGTEVAEGVTVSATESAAIRYISDLGGESEGDSSIIGHLTNNGTITSTGYGDDLFEAIVGVDIQSELIGTLTNNHVISATSSMDSEGFPESYAYGIREQEEVWDMSGDIVNSLGATISATATVDGGEGFASGVDIHNELTGEIRNLGSIEAQVSNASDEGLEDYAAFSQGISVGNENRANFLDSSEGTGGIEAEGKIYNAGSITAHAETVDDLAAAFGVNVYNLSGEIENTADGEVIATAKSTEDFGFAFGIYAEETNNGYIKNEGLIAGVGIYDADADGAEGNTWGASILFAEEGEVGDTEEAPEYGENSTVIDNTATGQLIGSLSLGFSDYFSLDDWDPENPKYIFNNDGALILKNHVDLTSAESILNTGNPNLGIVIGDYNQGSTGTLHIAAKSDDSASSPFEAGGYSQLFVAGTADIAGKAYVDVKQINTLEVGQILEGVVYAGEGLTGDFTSVTDNSALLNFVSEVWGEEGDEGGIDLHIVEGQTIVETVTAGQKPVGAPAAEVLDSQPEGLSEVTEKLNMMETDEEVAAAVETVLPAVSGGGAQLTNLGGTVVTNIVGSRQDLTRGLSSGDGMATNRNVWIKPFGGWTEQDDRQGVTGYDIDSYGFALGTDSDITSDWSVGFALAYVNSDVSSQMAAGSHSVKLDAYIAKVYATHMLDERTALNLQGGVGYSDYDSSRRLFDSSVATADYDGWQVQASAELERSYEVSPKTIVTPYVKAEYARATVDGYQESGAGALNLTVEDDSADSLVLGVGAKLNYATSDTVLLMANAGVGYDVLTERSNLTASFAGGGAQFTTQGVEPEELVYDLDLGAKFTLKNDSELTIRYGLTGREDYTEQSASVNLRFLF